MPRYAETEMLAVSKPEIMAPAGGWPQLKAAMEAGADAVYFGLDRFTARAKAAFEPGELGEAMRMLHRRGVKGYVTFNTLIFDEETGEAAKTLEEIAAAGADAIIVQDVAAAMMAREIAPSLGIHGSTQMSITSAEGVAMAERFGVSRVVLARELSLDDIRSIRAATTCELEIFVHGALCVSYSGQCFSSEAWGGRSANRGQCAQACRLPYDLMVDGEQKPLGDARYLLSPGDLYALRQIPEIVRMGISAVKIEGRYKDATYVALTTAAYRKAVDEAWAGVALSIGPAGELALEQVYSRGLGPHFLSGTDHQAVVRGRAPRHRGVCMGRVKRVAGGGVLVEPAAAHGVAPLKAGDGVVFDAADWRSPEEKEEGGRVFEVAVRDGLVELRFGNGAVDFRRVRAGDWVWRTQDPAIERAARLYTEAAAPVARQLVRIRVTAREGELLESEWVLAADPTRRVAVRGNEALAAASSRALDRTMLEAQFGRLGGTAYVLEQLEAEIEGRPFAAPSMLNQMRREAVARLELLQESARHAVRSGAFAAPPPEPFEQVRKSDSRLHLLVRTADQLEAAIAARPVSITLDYLELYGLKPSVDRVRGAGIEVRVASPRVLKPAEERVVHFLRKLECPVLVRSAGLLNSLIEQPHAALTGDFSLNAANAVAAQAYLAMGLERLAPTHDLNAAQVASLARRVGGERIEAIAYHHLPVFHTEHCVFCRFLSAGTSFKDCGHPCEHHRVALRDASGREHPVLADVGCRNTVFGAEAQQASAHLDRWREAGIADFRLEFAHESAEQVERVAEAFRLALAGRIALAELAARLRRASPQGTTEGSLFVLQPA